MHGTAVSYEFGMDIKVGEVLIAEDVRMDVEVVVDLDAFRGRNIETGDIHEIRDIRALEDALGGRGLYESAPAWLADLARAHLSGAGRDALISEMNRLAAMCARSRDFA